MPSLQRVLKYGLPYTDNVQAILIPIHGWNLQDEVPSRRGRENDQRSRLGQNFISCRRDERRDKAGKGFGGLPCSTIQQPETRLLLPAGGRGTDKWGQVCTPYRSFSSSWKFLAIMICSHARQHSRPEGDGVWWYVCQPPASGKSMDKCAQLWSWLFDSKYPSERHPVGHSTLGPKESHFLRNSTCWTIVCPRSVWTLVCGEAVLIVCYCPECIVWLVLSYNKVVSVSRM